MVTKKGCKYKASSPPCEVYRLHVRVINKNYFIKAQTTKKTVSSYFCLSYIEETGINK